MTQPIEANVTRPANPLFILLGIALLVAGLLGHVFAAKAIGGTHIAYRDHIGGYFLIALVTGVIIYLAGRFFWRKRPDITLLVFGFVQALFGVIVYINRFSVHG